MSDPAPRSRFAAASRFDSDEILSPPEALVCLLCAASLPLIVMILTENMRSAADPSVRTAIRDARALVPYVAIVALAIGGFRRTAATLAILVAAGGAFFGLILALLTGLSGEFVFFTLLQVTMLVAAVFVLRLREARLVAIGATRRIIAAAVAAILFAFATTSLISRNVAERERRADAAVSGHVPDTQLRR